MIRVAVLGAGECGPNLIRNFHNKQTSEVVWIIDRDASQLDEVHARFPNVQIGQDSDHNNLGNALLLKDRTSEAIDQFEQALRMSPTSASAHNNLGAALAQMAEFPRR